MSLREQLQVLVVDDMSTSRGLITQALEAFGIVNIHHAADAGEALGQIAVRRVHLVLSDYHMPGLTGLQFLRQLRSNPATRAVGFILITGRADRAIIDEGRALGMNNFIRKPFTTPELKSCLEAVVGRI